jgi:hypothetical protein
LAERKTGKEDAIMTMRGIARGRTIDLDESLPFPEGQTVRVTVEAIAPVDECGSPAAVLAAMREPPFVSPEDVCALERAIQEGSLPVVEAGVFDRENG